jgi:UDP-4-amino-4,6-dideoxy-N-acetyl-beta-L-altrosamine N-acetyltransferase
MGEIYRCRRLEADDLETVMHWRMLPDVTKFMNTDPLLTLEAQRKWFEALTSRGEYYYWVIEAGGIPCGVIHLADIDLTNKRCTWGYFVAVKKLRSLNLALSLEMSLYDFAFDKQGLNKVTGESFCANTAAIKMHELCGCKTEGILRRHVFKNGRYYDVCVQSMLAEEWRIMRSGFDYQKISFNAG